LTVTDRRNNRSPAVRPPVPDQSALVAALGLSGWRLTRCEGEVLRQSRFRPVFRYQVQYAAESGTGKLERILIGKADYRHGGAETFAFMRRLREAGFGGDDDTLIPEPIAYLEDLALLVQSEAAGRCLYEWLADPAADDREPPYGAGRWLGRLHGTRLASRQGALPADFEDQKLTVYCTELAEVIPEQQARLEECTREALARLRTVKGRRLVPTHGDYQPKNIYVDGPTLTVIDWDRGALAHPARDVGHFVGQCLTMAYAKRGAFEPGVRWNDEFLRGYAETAPEGWEPGLAPYVARTILEVLYYKLVVKPVSDPSFVPLWLDQLEDILQG
jgi:hypothetical protein